MKKIALLFTISCILSSSFTFAQIKLPAIFGDNMVLQRNMKVPVYGWATAGEEVQVEFMGKTFKAITGANGKWLVKLNAYKAGGPYQMRITGKSNTLTYTNILIGDVWLASGQSNMEFGIQTETHGAQAIPTATDGQIHFFYVPMNLSLQPVYDIAPTPADSPNGKWLVCSPVMMANPQWAWHGFSAIGFYFSQQIRKSTGVPIGMIGSYRGGTPVQAWISNEGLQEAPAFTKYVAMRQKLADNYDNAVATLPQRRAAYQDSLKIWNAEVGNAYADAIKKWEAATTQAKASGQIAPVRPKPSRPAPMAPADPLGGYGTPTTCYNGVIAPLVGYGIKGVLWYQGETNGDKLEDGVEYKDLFPRMINNWRKNWGQGVFPFLYVQLPNFRQPAVTPSSGNWPWVREGQQKALVLPKTGMAVITDAGVANDVHPPNKVDPANRLVLIARHNVYGEKVVYSGPVYKSMKIDRNKIILTFDEVNKGLVAGRPDTHTFSRNDVHWGMPMGTDPKFIYAKTVKIDSNSIAMTFDKDKKGAIIMNGHRTANSIVEVSGKELKGFGIAGADHKFVWAKAVISGNKIIVSSDEVIKPEAVRYNWADNPPGNLYNLDGLPARPFRTDDWSPFL